MDDYKKQIGKLLPDYGDDDQQRLIERNQQIDKSLQADENRLNAAALARIKADERRAQRQAETKSIEEQKRIAANIEELEALEDAPGAQAYLARGESDLSPYTGTTKRDVIKLLQSLNINMSLYLDKSDTYNLLSCLMTANESQLQAIYNNKKTPVAIKIVIKRLQEDAKLGNMDSVERLWDRIFGKNQTAAAIQLPEGVQNGLLPNTVVSREAYMIIRDTIIGK